ncbi:hypothetical protein DERF_003992 [Dermatophagoides farinae]|uniref:Uncharacterized protein n=1 Tax=Dermatophagoides farinae TaxID=6954 RepID=A0A922IDP0_DERFA|nr:hypothetical protein DERF_003992 [Dermatophagoides farinae]
MICPNVQDARMYTPYINKFVTQTITGHGQFGAYLSKFGISDDKNVVVVILFNRNLLRKHCHLRRRSSKGQHDGHGHQQSQGGSR